MSDDPQRVWPRIHRTVSFAGVFTSSFILRVDVLPKSENDTTDRSSRQTDWCVNEVIKVEKYSMSWFLGTYFPLVTCFPRSARRSRRLRVSHVSRNEVYSRMEGPAAKRSSHRPGYEYAALILQTDGYLGPDPSMFTRTEEKERTRSRSHRSHINIESVTQPEWHNRLAVPRRTVTRPASVSCQRHSAPKLPALLGRE